MKFVTKIFLGLLLAAPADAQQIRGRAVDEESRRPVTGVYVTAADSTGAVLVEAQTDANGFFTLRLAAAGRYTVALLQPGFAPASRVHVVPAEGTLTVPAFVLRVQAIELDSITAAVRAERPPGTDVGFSRPGMVVTGEKLAARQRAGVNVYAVAGELSGIRSRMVVHRGRRVWCIESTRRIMSMTPTGACEHVVVVLDGMVVDSPLATLAGLQHLDLYESVEFLPSGEAGYRYGLEASTSGALVLWTRGRGPHVSAARDGR